jgi:hypothetical protein
MVVDEFGSPEEMTLATVEEPEPGPAEISISVRAIGVNFPGLLVTGGTYQILPARAAGGGLQGAARLVLQEAHKGARLRGLYAGGYGPGAGGDTKQPGKRQGRADHRGEMNGEGPLSEVRVVDVSTSYAGPTAR